MTTKFFAAADGAMLAYSVEGQGVPVLALSGLTRNMRDFDYVAPHLRDVQLIRMDYRGRGQSAFTGAASYTVLQEGADALALLDHLGIKQAAILGTSRGGLIAMYLGMVAQARLLGVCLNDVGPKLETAGLHHIFDYIGRQPAAKTYDDLAAKLPALMAGFKNVPASRWAQEVRNQYDETPEGLRIKYDPALREPFLAAFQGDLPEAWPAFDALQALPVCLIRGENSALLSQATADEMRKRRPDMIFAQVPDRAHIPFLDEPAAVTALKAWIDKLAYNNLR
ncbi:hydrolase [Thioclava sp. SK-1]|uniref:alpha/beta fold hydrolase n=1 Tax=Thioclava sp. SK-1 TaxID=1889770 RepID=UPI0008256E52|nr:alpha/beta hydrolase [Thioclava sp. SK-1]OCX60943.1 hydrolase [Thioclava sp. SK-1]